MKPDVPIIVFTGFSEIPADLRNNIDALVEKGSRPEALLEIVDHVLQIRTSVAS
jgi:regulator of RNase E activity RraB